MRKSLFSLFMLVSCCVSAQQESMRDVFKQMPDSLLAYISQNNRLDFVDFIDSQMDAQVTNLFGGKSMMKKLTDCYAMLVLNEASLMEMRLLPVSEPVDSARQIICLVRTYGKDIQESTVDFYSLKWRRLPLSDYMPPAMIADSEMFVASFLDSQQSDAECDNTGRETPAVLTITPVSRLDIPADEEQTITQKPSITLNWMGKFVN